MNFSLKNMCRVCMNEEGIMFSVFSKEIRGTSRLSYADMLMACASLHVFKNDDLPQQICHHCLKHLSIAYSFKQQSEMSDATLREITKNPNIEFIKEEKMSDTELDLDSINENYRDDNEISSYKLSGTFLEDNKYRKPKLEPEKLAKFENLDEFQTEFLEDEFVLESENSTNSEIMPEENAFLGDNVLVRDILSPVKTEPDYTDIKLENTAFLDDNILVNNVFPFGKDQLEIRDPHYDTTNLKLNSETNQFRKTVLKPKRLNLKCPYCTSYFRSSQALRKHKRNHLKKLLKCEICPKEFRSTHGLKYHMKIHNGIKNYPCTFENCTRRFRLKQALDKHLSIHLNQKNHLCSLCGKTYCTYDALYYHLKAHRGERPYLCIHCGKTFKQSCHLKAHMWVHDGIKRHGCSKCGKCYTSGHQLKKHIRKHCPVQEPQVNKFSEQSISEIDQDQDQMHEYQIIETDVVPNSIQILAGSIISLC